MRLFSPVQKAVRKAAFVVLVLVIAACAEIGPADIGSPPDSASVVQTVPVSGIESGGSTATTGPQLPPARPEGFKPSLVIATSEGVVLIEDELPPKLLELRPLLPTEPVEETEVVDEAPTQGLPRLAIDDFFRGLVVQFESGVVEWFQAEGGDARTINVNNGRLLDVGFFNGTTEAIVAVGPQIDRVRLVDTQRFPLVTLAPDQELLDFSAGGGLYASVIADAECGALIFVNAVGEEVPVSRPAVPSCDTPRRPLYGSVALSGDGGAVAYTEITYRADGVEAETRLVVVDLAAGVVILAKTVGNSGDRITGLSYDGLRVAMMREASNSEVELLVVSDAETLAPDLGEFGTPVAATWARIPVTAGVVE